MSIRNTGTGEQSPEPFRTYAERYLDMGLSVFPCMGDDGKKPCVKWGSLQRRHIGSKGLDKWLAAFSGANIAIVTGKLSGITVVDCDNPNITLTELFDIYGETPLVVKTPRGGLHLYYLYNSEKSKVDKNRKIDIRSEGGFIVAPPSYNRSTGEVYHFIEGGIWDIGSLPVIKNNSGIQQGYSKGERNQKLFQYLLGKAKTLQNLTSLNEIAETFNHAHLIPPLDITEVHATAASVWNYKARGTLTSADGQYITLPMQKLKPIMFKHPKAVILYIDLHCCHAGINKTFAISPKAYTKRCGWSPNTIKQEIETLIRYGLIKLVYEGGNKGIHDPSKYKLL